MPCVTHSVQLQSWPSCSGTKRGIWSHSAVQEFLFSTAVEFGAACLQLRQTGQKIKSLGEYKKQEVRKFTLWLFPFMFSAGNSNQAGLCQRGLVCFAFRKRSKVLCCLSNHRKEKRHLKTQWPPPPGKITTLKHQCFCIAVGYSCDKTLHFSFISFLLCLSQWRQVSFSEGKCLVAN